MNVRRNSFNGLTSTTAVAFSDTIIALTCKYQIQLLKLLSPE